MKLKPGILIAYFLQLMIVLIVISSIFTGYYTFAIWSAIALFLTLTPAIVERRINMTIPWGLALLIVLSLYLHLAGEYFGWYLMYYPWYDKAAHFISGTTVALLGFTVVLLIDRYTEMIFSRRMIIFMIIMITMAFGAFWEIFEFLADTFLGGNMQHGNADSMLDMIFVLFGAVIVAGVGNFYMRRFPIERVAEIFGGNPRINIAGRCAEEKIIAEKPADTNNPAGKN